MRIQRLLAAAATLSPVIGQAAPNDDFVTVRYEATVVDWDSYRRGNCSECLLGYRRGDRLSGVLLIDLDKLTRADPPGSYNSFLDEPSFIAGFVPSRYSSSLDHLRLQDGANTFNNRDSFDIQEGGTQVTRLGDGISLVETDVLHIRANSSIVDFILGVSAVQNFELTNTDPVNLEGSINLSRNWVGKAISEIGGFIRLAVTKLSAKPGRCSI